MIADVCIQCGNMCIILHFLAVAEDKVDESQAVLAEVRALKARKKEIEVKIMSSCTRGLLIAQVVVELILICCVASAVMRKNVDI